MRVLFTGGAGFVGSHLTDALLDRGDQVIVLKDLSTGRNDNIREHIGNPRSELDSARKLAQERNFYFVSQDRTVKSPALSFRQRDWNLLIRDTSFGKTAPYALAPRGSHQSRRGCYALSQMHAKVVGKGESSFSTALSAVAAASQPMKSTNPFAPRIRREASAKGHLMRNFHFEDEYFSDRNATDLRRRTASLREHDFMTSAGCGSGSICDVGCSTGEFLHTVDWVGRRFGIEPNASAAVQARLRDVQIVESLEDVDVPLDVVLLRGVLQHLPDPVACIEGAARSLRPGGALVFLMTPNSGSLYFRIFQDLPALDAPRNFYVPSVTSLRTLCANFGFVQVAVEFPYLASGYATPWDLPKFFTRLIVRRRSLQSAFPRNMFNAVFRRGPM